jgi:hypothetical protein
MMAGAEAAATQLLKCGSDSTLCAPQLVAPTYHRLTKMERWTLQLLALLGVSEGLQ